MDPEIKGWLFGLIDEAAIAHAIISSGWPRPRRSMKRIAINKSPPKPAPSRWRPRR
jgi:hypothetical protein